MPYRIPHTKSRSGFIYIFRCSVLRLFISNRIRETKQMVSFNLQKRNSTKKLSNQSQMYHIKSNMEWKATECWLLFTREKKTSKAFGSTHGRCQIENIKFDCYGINPLGNLVCASYTRHRQITNHKSQITYAPCSDLNLDRL